MLYARQAYAIVTLALQSNYFIDFSMQGIFPHLYQRKWEENQVPCL